MPKVTVRLLVLASKRNVMHHECVDVGDSFNAARLRVDELCKTYNAEQRQGYLHDKTHPNLGIIDLRLTSPSQRTKLDPSVVVALWQRIIAAAKGENSSL